MRTIILFTIVVGIGLVTGLHHIPSSAAQTVPLKATDFIEVHKKDVSLRLGLCNKFQTRVSIKNTPKRSICMTQSEIETLRTELEYAEDNVRNGYDTIQNIVAYNMASIQTTDSKDPYAIQTKFMVDVLQKYAAELCIKDTTSPVVHIPKSGLYSQFTLTPICRIPTMNAATTNMTVRFVNSNNQARTFTVADTQFYPDFEVYETGTGPHTVSCSYTPSYCLSPKVTKRAVQVNAPANTQSQPHSIARMWNEVLLHSIAIDRVRPPVQARNLHHFSAMMYDIWTLYNPKDKPYLLNTAIGEAPCNTRSFADLPKNNMEEVMSYAAYRLITKRFQESPGYYQTLDEANGIMNRFGYDGSFTSSTATPQYMAAALGNYIAECYIAYGLRDKSNESGSHANTFYTPVNTALDPKKYGNPNLTDADHWQPIALEEFVDQGGTTITNGAAEFLSAEWGEVRPFSLRSDQKKELKKGKDTYKVYFDPGFPPLAHGPTSEEYIWNYMLPAVWSSHLDPSDRVQIDISPATLGGTTELPDTFAETKQFYALTHGGTKATGRSLNPISGKPYKKQMVPRGDYTRVIAEYWADGPNSETPPGHWFSILNTVSDHPTFHKKLWGTGAAVSDLEWDVKTYFTLGGAMHDAAIAAWGIKGYYDNIRPVSAIRALGQNGQSSDPKLPSYSKMGLPIIPGFIELVTKNDPLAKKNKKSIGRVKVRSWNGPEVIADTWEDTAGVGWILAGNWWPYQRPSFVTPPFGGYISGHSTFSRAAAEVLTSLTGSEYFPGGIFEVSLTKNEYLVFENGPSQDITLQWATFTDAADSCSLSRIWGGIHTPADDIAGRKVGIQVGTQATEFARSFFSAKSF